MRVVCHGCVSIVVWVVIIIILLCCASCKTRTVVVETVRTDTIYAAKHFRDSIWLHDSIHIKEGGDTVWIERWHAKYREKQVHDTTYIATHDTIPKPYPLEVKVPRELNWWQKFLQRIGGVALGMLLLWLVWQAWKFHKCRF